MTNFRDCAKPITRLFVFLFVLAGIFSFAATDGRAQQTGLGIAAVVNDDVISMLDLQLRTNMVIQSSNMEDSPETLSRIAPQVLRGLIDEKLMLQEAKQAGYEATQAEVQAGLERMAAGNDVSLAEFEANLKSRGIPLRAVSQRIEAEIAWGKFVGRRLSRNIKIGEEEINDEIQRIKNNAGKPEYLLAEIVLPVDDPSQESEVRNLALRLLQQMRSGAPFSAVAQNFSRVPSAAVGGDMGWVQASHLPPKILQAVQSLETGRVTQPIRSLGGYTLILLRDERNSPGLGQGETTLKVSQLHLNANGATSTEAMTNLADRLGIMTRGVRGCSRLERIAEQQGSSLSGSLGEVNLNALPDDMKKLLADLPVGQPSKPIATGGGLASMMVCERKTEELDMQKVRENIANQLRQERLDVAAQRHLRDLRRTAFVDIRL